MWNNVEETVNTIFFFHKKVIKCFNYHQSLENVVPNIFA